MSDDDINNADKNELHASKPIDGDRDIPSVAHNRDFSKLGIIAFIAVGLIAIILVAKDGLDKNDPKPLTAPVRLQALT